MDLCNQLPIVAVIITDNGAERLLSHSKSDGVDKCQYEVSAG